MEVARSTRHAKITGDLGEHLTLYWLSKHGFECARVDHTGIDIIARHPKRAEILGISVKSRSRSEGREESSLLIERGQFDKARESCQAFMCVPYFSLIVDGGNKIAIYLMPMSKLEGDLGNNKTVNWKMSAKAVAAYRLDPTISSLEFSYDAPLWGALSP